VSLRVDAARTIAKIAARIGGARLGQWATSSSNEGSVCKKGTKLGTKLGFDNS